MKLHLKSGKTVEVTRKTAAHYVPDKYGTDMCNWNIDIIEILDGNDGGYIAVGSWGCDGYRDSNGHYIRTPENFDKLIPVSSIESLSDLNKW